MVALLAGISGEDYGAADPGCAKDLQDTGQLWERWRSIHHAWIPPLPDVMHAYCEAARLLLRDYQVQTMRMTAALLHHPTCTPAMCSGSLGHTRTGRGNRPMQQQEPAYGTAIGIPPACSPSPMAPKCMPGTSG